MTNDQLRAGAPWVPVHYPIQFGDMLPAERRCVLVWCASSHIPWVGYLRYAAGCLDSPFFVVPHGNDQRSVDVVAWCDCLPTKTPDDHKGFINGRGFPARTHNAEDIEEQRRKREANRDD